MPSFQYASNDSWEKLCVTCNYTFTVKANDWNTAREGFLKYFGSHGKRTRDDLTGECRECKNHKRSGRTPNGIKREDQLKTQGGKCAICSKDISFDSGTSNHSAVVDHNQNTGTIRGILCYPCNMGLGKFKESKDILRAALDYLEWHQE